MKVKIVNFFVKNEDVGKVERILAFFPCRFLVAGKKTSTLCCIGREGEEEMEGISFSLFLFPENKEGMGKMIKESGVAQGPITVHDGEITIYCF